MIALPDYVRPELSFLTRCLRWRTWLVEPIEIAAGPGAYFGIRMIREPGQNRTRLAPGLQFLRDLVAAAHEPVVSSDMVRRFCRLEIFYISLLKLGQPQPRQRAACFTRPGHDMPPRTR